MISYSVKFYSVSIQKSFLNFQVARLEKSFICRCLKIMHENTTPFSTTSYSERQPKDTPKQFATKLLGSSLQWLLFELSGFSNSPQGNRWNSLDFSLHRAPITHRSDPTSIKIQVDRLYRKLFFLCCCISLQLHWNQQLHNGSTPFHCSETKLEVTRWWFKPA